MWTTRTKVIVAVILCLVIPGVVIGVWGALRVRAIGNSGTKLTIRSTAASSSRTKNKTIAGSDCRAPTAGELAASPFIRESFRVCEIDPSVPWEQFEDERDWQFQLGLPPLTATSKPLAVYSARGAEDLIVSLDDVSGSFHSMVLHFEEDFFGNGFSKAVTQRDEEVTAAEIKSSIAAMITSLPKAHVLAGDSPDATDCGDGEYTFQVSAPKAFSITPPGATVETPVLSGSRLNGVFRLALDHLDYSCTLDNKECRIRLLMNRCHETLSLMGVKQVMVDGVYKFYDPVANELIDTPNANVWSFWNQNKYTNPENQNEDEEDSLPLREAFRDYRLPMPIDIINKEIDFADFRTKNATLTLLVGGSIGFRGAVADDFTAAQLATQPIEQLKRFDLNNLQLQALFTFDG